MRCGLCRLTELSRDLCFGRLMMRMQAVACRSRMCGGLLRSLETWSLGIVPLSLEMGYTCSTWRGILISALATMPGTCRRCFTDAAVGTGDGEKMLGAACTQCRLSRSWSSPRSSAGLGWSRCLDLVLLCSRWSILGLSRLPEAGGVFEERYW